MSADFIKSELSPLLWFQTWIEIFSKKLCLMRSCSSSPAWSLELKMIASRWPREKIDSSQIAPLGFPTGNASGEPSLFFYFWFSGFGIRVRTLQSPDSRPLLKITPLVSSSWENHLEKLFWSLVEIEVSLVILLNHLLWFFCAKEYKMREVSPSKSPFGLSLPHGIALRTLLFSHAACCCIAWRPLVWDFHHSAPNLLLGACGEKWLTPELRSMNKCKIQKII